MKNKLIYLANLHTVTGRARLRTVRAMIAVLSLISLPLARASDTLPPEKSAGDPTAQPVPPTGQRSFDKSVPSLAASPGTGKKATGSNVSGVLPPGMAQADKKSAAAPAVMSVRSAANLAAGPVSGQASPEDLKNYQKPDGDSASPSVLVLPVSVPGPRAAKVAVGTVTGPASPEDLRGYVKPAILSDTAPVPGAGKVVVGTVTGPASPEDLRGYVKPAGAASGAVPVLLLPVSGLLPGAGKVALGTGPASPEDYKVFVKSAVLPDAPPEPARAPTSGTVPPAEQRRFQK